VVIGWLPNGPDPVEPDCPPIALRYSKASKAFQSASNKGHGTRRSSASKMTKRKRLVEPGPVEGHPPTIGASLNRAATRAAVTFPVTLRGGAH